MTGEIQEFTLKLQDLLGLEGEMTPNHQGVYTFHVDENIEIQYADLKPGLNLMSYLSKLPKEGLETLLMSLMQVNLFGKATGGGVLGYDPESQLLTFTKAFPYKLTFEEFKEALEDFINYVELWKEELEKTFRKEKSLLTF